MEDKRLKATARLLEVMNTLRRECPWDREQTFDSLRSNTIEETYELADAITDHNMEGIKEELGDLLLHVVFYSKLGEEEGAFDFGDVADALCDKLIYRHPHVYGDIHANTPDQVKENSHGYTLEIYTHDAAYITLHIKVPSYNSDFLKPLNLEITLLYNSSYKIPSSKYILLPE